MSILTIKYFSVRLLPLFLLVAAGATMVMPELAHASAVGEIKDGVSQAGTGGAGDFQDILQNVVNLLLFIVGAAAVVMLILGGFRYITSNGDSSAITSAKNTILYAVIGIIVALAAFAIVNFILEQF